MSRVIEQIATVQFQANTRQANAAMQALQDMANDLNRAIDGVNRNIANLGKDVPKDNPQLLNYQNQLKGLQKDLKDVQKAQRDFLKGAKAADQLWKAAQEQNIETLSMRSIKAGVSGLRKRQENLAADKSDANNMRDFRIIQQVIDESERLMKDFRADVDNTIQTIRDGGTVSVQSMRNALKAAEELRDSVEEGTGEWRDYQQQVEFMTKSLDEYSAAQRRAKGEIVDSNDARREALKLTEDGERAAAKERELADAVIAGTRQQINDYQQLRKFQQERIDKTEEEISTNLRLQEAEHARLAVIDKDMRDAEAEDRRSAKSYRDRSESASSSADWLDAIARNRDNEANQLRERVQNTQAEADAIKSRIEVLNQSANATKKNSKAYKELQELQGQLKDKTKELNTQTKDYEKALENANKAQQRANEKQAEAVQLRAKAENYEDKAAHAEENREKVLDREAKKIRELYMQYDQLDDRLKKERAEQAATDRAMIDAGNQQAAAEGRKAQAQVATIKSISNAIKILEEQNEVIDQNSKEWQENTAIIQRLQERLNEMKVAPVLQMMTERMERVPQLSDAALQETKKFWEAMLSGAEKGSKELAIYEGNLKVIAEEERQRSRETLKASADRLTKGGFGQMTTEQLRQSIEDAKKYQLTLKSTSEEAQKLSVAITDAEEHIKRHGIEAERAARKQEEANKKAERATRDQLQAEQDLAETMRQRLRTDTNTGVSNIQRLSTDALAETKKYWEAVRDGAEQGTTAYKQATQAVKLLANEEQRRKDLATSENIAAQMADLNNLSVTGLAEVKRYWQAMADGAKRGSDEAKEAEAALKRINALESERSTTALKASADRLSGNIGLMSQGDIRQAIEDAKKYQLTLGSTSEEAKKLAQAIVNAEEHLKRYGVEAERTARKQEEDNKKAERTARDKEEVEAKAQQDQLRMMRERIVFEKQRQSLSADALTETKKYWEAVKNGANEGSWAQKNALTMMERITEEEQRRNTVANEKKTLKLSGKLNDYSEQEIREAIEATKQLMQAVDMGDAKYKSYGESIARAEEYLKKYGLEAQRQAVRETQAAGEAKQAFEDAVAGKLAKASMEELDDAIKKIKEYQASIKDPTGDGKETFGKAKEQVNALTDRLNALKGVAEKVTGTFASADDVIARFNQHLAEPKIETATQQTEKLAQTLDEKLNAATSNYDGSINRCLESIDYWEKELKESEDKVTSLEAEYNNLVKLLNSGNPFKRLQGEMKGGWKRANNIQSWLEGDGSEDNYGWRPSVQDAKNEIKDWKEHLEYWKQKKAEALGLNEAEEQVAQTEEKLQQTRRMTREEMQQGIKILEEEAMAQDRATVDGQKKWEQLRSVIDQMNQELKESTGEWMKLADAEKLAEQAGKDTFLNKEGKGFIASPEEIQKATQALERRRDALIKNMKTSGEATKEQERELADLTKKIKDLKFEQDNLNMSQEKMQMLMRTPTNAVSLDELRAAIKRADGELKRMEGSLGQNNAQYKAFAEQVRNAKNQLKEMEGQAKASATAWEKAWSRLKTYVVMYMGFNAVWNKVTGTADDIMELSDKMGEVRKTTQLSAEAVGELSENLTKLDVRTPLTELMSISASAGQLGLKSVEDIQGFTEAANKLMIALPEMGKEAATEMMRVAIATGEVNKIRKQLEEGTIEGSSATAVAMEKIASTIDRLRASSASTAPEITDFVKRLGAVGAQSGISIDQVAALGSTISSLGMRVEMSATALSRMIPAIKNNAFAIANAIGVAPEALRSLFEAGRGMEAILMIFQHLKEQNANADTIESLLGIGNMKDVMKQLNQQGARAGIVFAGLSQNVDELRKQLVVANEAYEENVAITNEFNRMNDTAAARWERFKNRIEEMFVSDWAQRMLGGLIGGLNKVLDLLVGKSGLSAALYTIITLFGVLNLKIGAVVWSALAAGLTKIVDLFKNWRIALDLLIIKMKEMTAAQWTNVFLAIAAAVAMLIYKLQQLSERASIVANEMAKANEEILKQTGAVDKLFRSVAKTNAELENAKKRLVEVERVGNDATESENALKKASSDHAAAIRDINSKYGQYLGYMLSETSSAEQLARARELINAKLRETITLKQQEAALGSVEQEYGGKVNKKGSAMDKQIERIFGDNYEAAARVSVAISEAAQKYSKDSQQYEKAVKKIIQANKKYIDQSLISSRVTTAAKSGVVMSDESAIEGIASGIMTRAKEYREAVEEYQHESDVVNHRFEATTNINRKKTREATVKDLNAILGDWKDLVDQYRKAEGEEKEKLAAEVYKQQRAYANAVANNADYFENDKRKDMFDKNIANMKTYEKGLRSVAGEAIRTIDAMERAEGKITGLNLSNDGESDKNPWGGGHDAASTDWKNMTANQLVERRKQMKDFVNAIQTDTDVQSVLKEDAALKKAIENGMSADMRTVIEWYNTERLKIQDELYARHLTNTGDWLDPKKSRESWRKQLQLDLDNYLKMLDAYYTKRKAEIQEAGNDEGLTEAEIRNRTLANDTEWQQRRMELQQIYLGKREKVAKDEVTAIMAILAEMDEDTPEMVEKLIGKSLDKWKILEEKAPEMAHRVEAKFVNGVSQSMLKMQQIVHQQMKAIQDIIDKERPFNGITKNLRENLVTMGVLTADMTKERDRLMKENADMADFNRRQAEEEVKRTSFMLGEAEHAYTATVEDVMRRMADAGMTAWAEELKASPKMQEGMMAQLRQTYDAVQEAIKKEASLMKKQAEIMWNNILLPGGNGKTTVKDAFEQAIAQLGIEQGRVSRANSLIGAGQASDRVADKLAINQMQLQLAMQTHYYNLMRKQGKQRIDDLERQIELAKQAGDIEKAKRLELDKQHADMSLNLAMSKEQTDILKQQEEIIARTEESQARLYKELREWGELISSSVQSVFEASNAGNREYYNELAKLNLTGKGGPGAGTYIVIENEGTEDASAHYEYLDERAALERQREIEQQNAQADAWKKLMDDLNAKMNDMITDQMNAAALDANTAAVWANTEALMQTMSTTENGGTTVSKLEPISQEEAHKFVEGMGDNPMQFWTDVANGKAPVAANGQPESAPAGDVKAQQPELVQNTDAITGLTTAVNNLTDRIGMAGTEGSETAAPEEAMSAVTEGRTAMPGEDGSVTPQWPMTEEQVETIKENTTTLWEHHADAGIAAMQRMAEATADLPSGITDPWPKSEDETAQKNELQQQAWGGMADVATAAMDRIVEGQGKVQKGEEDTEKQMVKGSQSAFAKMTAAANLYGIAYQAMSNDNLSTAQKFQMIGLQAAGNAAIAALTTDFSENMTKTTMSLPVILAKCLSISPIAGAAIFAALSAVLGGMMGMAASSLSKGKSEISRVTGASVGAGRLATGMMTYAEGNVNEMTDPDTLTPGRSYNVDGADGHTYRAKYTGKNAKTHITSGPEFHLVGEKGQEAIIDAHTTRNIRLNEPQIWADIQTLYNGGRLSATRRRRGRGVTAFAEGNLDEFEEIESTMGDGSTGGGIGTEQMMQLQASLDRNSDVLERALTEGIKGVFNVYGKGGLVDSYDTGKKTVTRHGERY